jgi:hypothetical protein
MEIDSIEFTGFLNNCHSLRGKTKYMVIITDVGPDHKPIHVKALSGL